MSTLKLGVGLNGAAGRMGQMLTRLIVQGEEFKLEAALEAAGHPDIGRDIGEISGVGPTGILVADRLPECGPEVMVDFSSPEATAECARHCAKRKIPMVIGTTGLADKQLDAVMAASTTVPVVLAPNMSVGVNVLLALVGQAARMLGGDYDVEIVETHHRFKKDAPSGTALKLAERIAEVMDRDIRCDLVHGRQGQVGARSQREIGVHAVRAGDVVGDHVVTFATMGERIELVHRAHSRETFARGALRAARFVADKPAGLYTMADVLGL